MDALPLPGATVDTSWLYSDRDSPVMKKLRRIDLWFNYAAATAFIFLYLLTLVPFELSRSAYPLETQTEVVGAWAVGFGVYILAVHYVFIKTSKNPLRDGVALAENVVRVL